MGRRITVKIIANTHFKKEIRLSAKPLLKLINELIIKKNKKIKSKIVNISIILKKNSFISLVRIEAKVLEVMLVPKSMLLSLQVQ